MKLLIVEDNPQMRRTIRAVVADLAEAVAECGDGGEALAAHAEHRPDVVLMDIEMKGVDGLSATRRITAAFPGARVVIVTAHDDRYYREAAREAGACGYVLKENLLDLKRLLIALGREPPEEGAGPRSP